MSNDTGWGPKVPIVTVKNKLLSLAERTHADKGISYEVYLERMNMLRMVAEELDLDIPTALAIRSPRRGNLGDK